MQLCQGEPEHLKSGVLEFAPLAPLETFASLLRQPESKLKETHSSVMLKEPNDFTGHNQRASVNHCHSESSYGLDDENLNRKSFRYDSGCRLRADYETRKSPKAQEAQTREHQT